jgi:hypothetical protein
VQSAVQTGDSIEPTMTPQRTVAEFSDRLRSEEVDLAALSGRPRYDPSGDRQFRRVRLGIWQRGEPAKTMHLAPHRLGRISFALIAASIIASVAISFAMDAVLIRYSTDVRAVDVLGAAVFQRLGDLALARSAASSNGGARGTRSGGS